MDLAGRTWRMTDELSGTMYEREGHELQQDGLNVELDAWGVHVLKF
jgi:hypothetical protein